MPAQSGYADVNGTRLYYEIQGSGDPLLLIHGFGADLRIWDETISHFSRQFEVIRCDLRGFGRSAVPMDTPYSHSDDLKALFDMLHIERVHVVGHSMGGKMALQLALAYPAAVRSLVLVDTDLDGYQWSREWDESWAAITARTSEAGYHAALPLLLAHPLFVPIWELPAVRDQFVTILTEYSGWHTAHEDPHRMIDPPTIQRLEQIKAPTLVVIGERDLPDFHHMADVLAARIPGACKQDFPGVGHVVPLEAPERLLQSVLDFLAPL